MSSLGLFLQEKELIQEFLQTTKAPCDNCQNAESCREANLACPSFRAWVNERDNYQDFSPVPSTEIYLSIYRR